MMPARVTVQPEHSLQLYPIHEIHLTAAKLSQHKEKKEKKGWTAFHKGI